MSHIKLQSIKAAVFHNFAQLLLSVACSNIDIYLKNCQKFSEITLHCTLDFFFFFIFFNYFQHLLIPVLAIGGKHDKLLLLLVFVYM